MIKQLVLAGMLTMAQPSMALDPTNPNYENIKLENNGSSNSAFIVNNTISSTQQILGVTSVKQYTKTNNGTQVNATLRSQQFTWFCNAGTYVTRTGSQLATYTNINNNNHFYARYENQNDEYTSKYQYTSNGTTWYSWTSIAIKVQTNGILTHPAIYYHTYFDIATYYEANRSELTFKKEVWITNQNLASEIMNIGETGTEENRRLTDYSTKFNNGDYGYNYSYNSEEVTAYYMDDYNGEENKIDIYTTKNTPTYIYIKLSAYNKTHPGSESGNNNKYESGISYTDDIELNGYCPLNISTNKGIGLETYYVIDQDFNQEVIDVPSVMFTILGMPFTFISTAFNLTLFPGTPYAINFTNLFLAIIAILVFIMILRIIIKNKG